MNEPLNNRPPLTPVLDFLWRHAPFDHMAPAHLDYLAKRLKLGFYSRGEVVLSPEDGPVNRFYLIKQGRICGESGGQGEEERWVWELVAGECFPIGALLSRRPVRTVNRAVEDTFCFELEREDFEQLLNKSPVFHDFCTRRLASLLDDALRGIQTSSANRVSEVSSLSTPLRRLTQRRPITCAPESSVHDALQRMHDEHVGSIVVIDSEHRPLGMFTLHDLLSRVSLPGHNTDTPIAEVMTASPRSLEPQAHAYEAALLMAQHGISHVCVVEAGRLVGVVSERDLFSLQRVGLVNLSRAIQRAEDIPTLAELGGQIHLLVEQMLAQGASVDQITQIITTLNDNLTLRVLALILEESSEPSVPFTWLAFGSEGRSEQTLKTDQDNGILFQPPEGMSADEVRAQLLPMAERVNAALARVGFPLCPGKVMASNPECCLSLEEWRQRFARWIDQGTPEHVLKSTIFFDFRPLWGDSAPAAELRAWLLEQTERNSRFRRQMAEVALRLRPPLGLWRDFVLSSNGEHPHTLDLKLNGVTPFVDAARLIALAYRIGESNTIARLEAAAAAGKLKGEDVAAWTEAYHYIQLLRMRAHRRQAEAGEALSNHVDPDDLNELDRRILKEAFRQARKLQAKIALEYQL